MSAKRNIYTKAVTGLFFRYLKNYPGGLGLILIGVTTIQLGNLAAPWFLRQLLNTLVTNSPSPALMPELVSIIGLIALAWIVGWIGNRIEYISNTFVQSRIMADIMTDSFHYLLGHSHNFFISNFAGSLTHRVNKIGRSFEVLMDSVVLQFLPTFLLVAGAVAILWSRHPILGAVLAVWSVSFVLIQVYISNRIQPIRNLRAQAETNVTAALADSISNHATSQLFSGVEHEIGSFRQMADIWRRATIRSWLADHSVWAILGLLMMVIQLGMLYLASEFWTRGALTVGDFILIQAYLLMIFERLVAINRELRRFFDALADASEMVEILEIPHEVADSVDADVLSVERGTIAFNSVDFHFHTENSVLTDFSLAIGGGEKVALVGPSGAGKTTITKLLLRLYDVNAGEIKIDGQNIAHVTQESLRNAISFVPQEPILFHRTLIDNIRYGKRDASEEEVIEAAKKAHCHEFISSLQLGYQTHVGERGVKLSGGERQRIGIARAILKDAPILVLDEATSSLDSESEALIQDALATLMEGKTVVVIAHRLSTIMKMDRIVVLEGGKIVAEGSHEQLLAQDGLYKKIWNIQAGGFLQDEESESDTIYEAKQ